MRIQYTEGLGGSAISPVISDGCRKIEPTVESLVGRPLKGDQHRILRKSQGKLQGFVTFAYKTGWRASEITNLTWSNVDLSQGIVRFEAGETKNDEGRTVYLDEELK